MVAPSQNGETNCRFCSAPLERALVDLGTLPLANSYLAEEDLESAEPRFSLRPLICERCFLVQLPEWESPEAIFSDYAYFSSFSDSWLEHARRYCGMAQARFGLDETSQVIEVASNDGYLLQYFQSARIPVLGIEPARNVAEAAIDKGIPTRVEFFGEQLAVKLAEEGIAADLLIGNNVLAHTPHLNDFVRGIRTVLAPGGVATLEFPHLLRLLEETQFDTIYHEHFSYFSLTAVRRVFEHHGLTLFDVEELPTHGGSLRIYAAKTESARPTAASLDELLQREADEGLLHLAGYERFASRVDDVRRQLLEFLADARAQGRSVLAYGAPAKGNTLLCYCGVGTESISFTVDRSPHKQGRFLPGSRLPVRPPEELIAAKPDYVLILPWNLRSEIMAQNEVIREWGGRFVTAVPRLQIWE